METLQKHLEAMGFKSPLDRSRWLKERKGEIEAFFQNYGTEETKKHFRISSRSLEKLGILHPKRKEKKPRLDISRSKSSVKKRLTKIGFTFSQRKDWLQNNKDEIRKFFDKHGLRKTQKQFHVGYSTLKRLGIITGNKGKKKKTISNKVFSFEEMVEALPSDTNIGLLIAEGFIKKINELKSIIKACQEEKNRLMEDNDGLREEINGLEKEKKKLEAAVADTRRQLQNSQKACGKLKSDVTKTQTLLHEAKQAAKNGIPAN